MVHSQENERKMTNNAIALEKQSDIAGLQKVSWGTPRISHHTQKKTNPEKLKIYASFEQGFMNIIS